MGFKEDWSFLDKISMGAVGTEAVIRELNLQGHNIIELERYCTSNKIWSTKIKRLRIPDLLCLKCGKRIESRAKSKLGIIMSDATANPDRRWFAGLRDEDLVAFIQCYKNPMKLWDTDGVVNLFSVENLKRTEDQTILSAPKSFSEGAEKDRTWYSAVPSYPFTVNSIDIENGKTILRMRKANGNNLKRTLKENEFIYVSVGDSYPANAKMTVGIIEREEVHVCGADNYDFFEDLISEVEETVYIAVKALGYIGVNERSIIELRRIVADVNVDKRIVMEAYSSLLRLGEDVLDNFEIYAMGCEEQLKMEFVLILGEMNNLQQVTSKLLNIAVHEDNSEELRSAAIWSLNTEITTLIQVIDFCFNTSEIISNHAIAKIENNFKSELTSFILNHMDNNNRINAICARILSSCELTDAEAVVSSYLNNTNTTAINWIMFTIGLSGRSKYEEQIMRLDLNNENVIEKLQLLWDFMPNYIDNLKANSIEFTKLQK